MRIFYALHYTMLIVSMYNKNNYNNIVVIIIILMYNAKNNQET